MRKQNTLTGIPTSDGQRGFALFIVLMVMIVVAFLVVTAAQSYNTEQEDQCQRIRQEIGFVFSRGGFAGGRISGFGFGICCG